MPLQAKSQEVRGNKDFVSTPWVGTSDEVEEAAKSANSAKPEQELKVGEYQGKVRKTTCNSFGMGMKVSDHTSYCVCLFLHDIYVCVCSFKLLKFSAVLRQKRVNSTLSTLVS